MLKRHLKDDYRKGIREMPAFKTTHSANLSANIKSLNKETIMIDNIYKPNFKEVNSSCSSHTQHTFNLLTIYLPSTISDVNDQLD